MHRYYGGSSNGSSQSTQNQSVESTSSTKQPWSDFRIVFNFDGPPTVTPFSGQHPSDAAIQTAKAFSERVKWSERSRSDLQSFASQVSRSATQQADVTENVWYGGIVDPWAGTASLRATISVKEP